jgi:hypothetical protein
MDKRYSEALESIKKPCFVLIKNLDFEHPEDLDSPVSRGEIIGYSTDYEELRKKIPDPILPEDDYKLSLFEKKFGDMQQSVARFDDSPLDISEGEPNDYEIFGESYTILWICDLEEDSIADFLVQQYLKNRDLISIWEFYIDRMHIYPPYSLEQTSVEYYENLCNEFEERVSSSKSPPSENEWNELNDYL